MDLQQLLLRFYSDFPTSGIDVARYGYSSADEAFCADHKVFLGDRIAADKASLSNLDSAIDNTGSSDMAMISNLCIMFYQCVRIYDAVTSNTSTGIHRGPMHDNGAFAN